MTKTLNLLLKDVFHIIIKMLIFINQMINSGCYWLKRCIVIFVQAHALIGFKA